MGGDDSQKLLPWRGTSLLSGAQETSGSQQNHTLTQINQPEQTRTRGV
jgi:hypothetical protein